MKVVTSKKIVNDSQVSICLNSIKDEKFLYAHTIKTDNYTLLIVLKKNSYYSYATVVNTKENNWLNNGIQAITGETDIVYAYNTKASVLSKISAIGKKYKHIISLKLEANDVALEEIEKQVNSIPWKFLNYITPLEIEERVKSVLH